LWQINLGYENLERHSFMIIATRGSRRHIRGHETCYPLKHIGNAKAEEFDEADENREDGLRNMMMLMIRSYGGVDG
jgi:hypothetical protein